MERLLLELATDEDQSRIQQPSIVDKVAFRLVVVTVTHKATLLCCGRLERAKVTKDLEQHKHLAESFMQEPQYEVENTGI